MIFHLFEKNLKHIGTWLSALGVFILLSACGQKGALYLPEEPNDLGYVTTCLLYTSPSPRDRQKSRMPSSA